MNVGTTLTGIATYKGGSYRSNLLFEYVVGLSDMTLDLNYIDAQSLHLGFADGVIPGYIKQAGTNPSIDANLDLALPGSAGLLGLNSDIKNRQPNTIHHTHFSRCRRVLDRRQHTHSSSIFLTSINSYILLG